jgi:beta-galactosidase
MDWTFDRREALALGAATTALLSLPASPRAAAVPGTGRDQPFDANWLFRRGEGTGQEAAVLDDSGWRAVDLPHDWSREDIPGADGVAQIGPFDKHAVGGTATGFTVGGEGWYRKHFRLAGLAPDARVELRFDGVMVEGDVWLNGQHLASSVAGYRPFVVDLIPALVRDGDNVLAVRTRNLGQNSRWYAGSGIYRQVRLDVLPGGARIARYGVGAATRRIAGGAAEVAVTTRIEAPAAGLTLVTRLRDADGRIAAERAAPATAEVAQLLPVRGARLWSPGDPQLYTLETELRRGSAVVDRMVQNFGIRIITMDAQRGLAINGVVTKLRGGCIHHDNGLLGACAFSEADERRIRLLKARGYNAIRSSHNIPSRSLREACDRLGMLMIAEGFDAWNVAKLPDDFSTRFPEHWREVIEALVLSGRNSPSIILWSIGNEIPARNTDSGVEWQWRLANEVRRLDPTRPVTAALNGVLGQPMIAGPETARAGMAGKADNASSIFLDVPGYNYRLATMEQEQPSHPSRVVYASETFPKDVVDYQRLAERAPWFLGEFVWTAMDYIGEAGCGANAVIKAHVPFYIAGWPWTNAWCGDIDLIGGQKPPSLARDVAWGISPLEVVVARPVPEGMHEFIAQWGWPDELPHWSWAGQEGKVLAVRLYTGGDRVELRLNGQTVGGKAVLPADRMRVELPVPYAPGLLEAVAFKDGREIGRRRLETAGEAAALRLQPEQPGRGLAYVRLDVLDSAGRHVPEAQRKVAIAIEGAAELLAFGNAAPTEPRSLTQPRTETFRGSALAILRARGAGPVRVSASGEGLSPATTTITFA